MVIDWAQVENWGDAISNMAENVQSGDEKSDVAKDWIAMYARNVLDLVSRSN